MCQIVSRPAGREARSPGLSLSAGAVQWLADKASLTTALRTGSCPGTQIPPCPEPADAVVGALCRSGDWCCSCPGASAASEHDELQRVACNAVRHRRATRGSPAAGCGRVPGAVQGPRVHTDSDLRCYLSWCAGRGLDPLTARRPHLELYIRWMQEVRRFKPSTVPRRFSVVAGFYRTCVIDGALEHSPGRVRPPPPLPAESPALGLTHLQFEALLSAARHSANDSDFALVAMLGLLGLRIFEATGATSRTSARSTATACFASAARAPSRADPAAASGRAGDRPGHRRPRHRADPAQQPRHPDGPPRRHPPAAAARRRAGVRMPRMHPHMLRHTFVTTMLDAGVGLRDVQIAARHADPRTTMRYDRARKNLDRHPNYILAAYMASGT